MKHHPRIWERPMLLLLFLFGVSVHSIPRHRPVPEQALHPGPQAGGF